MGGQSAYQYCTLSTILDTISLLCHFVSKLVGLDAPLN